MNEKTTTNTPQIIEYMFSEKFHKPNLYKNIISLLGKMLLINPVNRISLEMLSEKFNY